MDDLPMDAADRFGHIIYDWQGIIEELRANYEEVENIERLVMRAWMEGFRTFYTKAIHDLWKTLYGSQADQAEALGIDRSTLTKKKEVGTLTLDQLFWIFFVHPNEFARILACPVILENAIVAGYMKAMSCVRSQVIANPEAAEEDEMTREKYDCLREIYGDCEWKHALEDRDRDKMKAASAKIFERGRQSNDNSTLKTVDDLLRLNELWFEPFWLSIGVAMDCVLPKPRQPGTAETIEKT